MFYIGFVSRVVYWLLLAYSHVLSCAIFFLKNFYMKTFVKTFCNLWIKLQKTICQNIFLEFYFSFVYLNTLYNDLKKSFITITFWLPGFFSHIFSKWYGFSWGLLSRLDLLLQISIRNNLYKINYESLSERIIWTGLKINKKPAFQQISDNFHQQWNTVLYDTEKRLVKLLQQE